MVDTLICLEGFCDRPTPTVQLIYYADDGMAAGSVDLVSMGVLDPRQGRSVGALLI